MVIFFRQTNVCQQKETEIIEITEIAFLLNS